MEVLWKTVTGILNLCLEALIQFHDILHRFLTDRGTGIAYLYAKLTKQLMGMREEVLCEVLLDLHKAYDTLDRGHLLDILVVYGVVTWALCLLWWYWE